jgi:hypothetical protein
MPKLLYLLIKQSTSSDHPNLVVDNRAGMTVPSLWKASQGCKLIFDRVKGEEGVGD